MRLSQEVCSALLCGCVLGFIATLCLLPTLPRRTHAFWRPSPCSPAEDATSQLPLCPELVELNGASHHFLKDLETIDEPGIRAELEERQRRVEEAEAEVQEREEEEARAAEKARQEKREQLKNEEEEERKWQEQRTLQKRMIRKREGQAGGPETGQPEPGQGSAEEVARQQQALERQKRALERQKQALEKQREELEREAAAERQQQKAALERLRKREEEEEKKQEEEEERLEEHKLASCRKAERGETCYLDVVWSMHEGIHEHPDWYPGLTSQSSFEEFQFVLNITGGESKCPKPCLVAEKGRPPLTGCRTATPADETCYTQTLWAKTHGIYEHPTWYEGLTGNSSFEMFQNYLRTRRNIECPHPCVVAVMK